MNFGGAEGPWDHSRRLERLQGVRIVGIADPDRPKAEAVRAKKVNGDYAEVYGECAVYGDYKEAIKACKPDVAFIGEEVEHTLIYTNQTVVSQVIGLDHVKRTTNGRGLTLTQTLTWYQFSLGITFRSAIVS